MKPYNPLFIWSLEKHPSFSLHCYTNPFLYEMIHEIWGTVEQGVRLTEQQLALFRLANMHAVAAGAQAVDLVYHAAGTSAIFTTNPLERFFRDIHVATQHRCASPEELYQAGRVLLGLPLTSLI